MSKFIIYIIFLLWMWWTIDFFDEFQKLEASSFFVNIRYCWEQDLIETSENPLYFDCKKYSFWSCPSTLGNFYVTWTLEIFKETFRPDPLGDMEDNEIQEILTIVPSNCENESFRLWVKVGHYLISDNQKRVENLLRFKTEKQFSQYDGEYLDIESYINDGKEHVFHVKYDGQWFESEPRWPRSPVVYRNIIR